MKNKYVSICLLIILMINVLLCIHTKATDKVCHEGNIWDGNVTTIEYCGNYYGVEIYSNNIDKVNLAIPWIEKISKDYNLDCELIIYDDSQFSLNKLIVESSQALDLPKFAHLRSAKYELSRNYDLGTIQGLYGEYNNKYKRIVVSSNLSDTMFQLTVMHELGHYIDDVNNVSQLLTDEQVEFIRQLTKAHHTGKNPDKDFYTKGEAFAEMFMMQQVGIL